MKAYWGYNETVSDFENTLADGHQPKIVERDLLDFFADRLKVHLRERGVRHDHVEAVFALGGEDDLVRLLARVDALSGSSRPTTAKTCWPPTSVPRISLRLRKKGRHDLRRRDPGGSSFAGRGARLVDGLTASAASAIHAIAEEKYVAAMEAMANLRAPVDLFFDKVTVNADDADIRANRLRLLSQFRSTLGRIADFSRIEG